MTAAARLCTNCKAPMRKLGLAAHYQRSVEIDVCEPCSLIWFDDMESVRLAGPGMADLVRVIHDSMKGPKAWQPFPSKLPCPVCNVPLKRVFNITRHGKTSHLECVDKHGIFQSFALFLAEKGYFRQFTWADIKRLTESGKRLSCFNCGALLESRPHDECTYCRSPVGMIDPARLASAIDADKSADGLKLVPAVKQSSCSSCGGAIDMAIDMVCPHCMSVVTPVETAKAAAASDAVDAKVRENYARQLPEVSRRKLGEVQSDVTIDFRPPRSEGMRRGAIILIAMMTIGSVVFNVMRAKAPKTHYVMDANGNKVGMTAKEFNDADDAQRRVAMAKIPHAPAGVAPPELQVAFHRGRATLVSSSTKRMRVSVGLAYEQYEGFWKRCRLVNEEGGVRKFDVTFIQPGQAFTLFPENCSDKLLEDGKLEFRIQEQGTYKDIFKSDSAFYD